MKGFQGEQELKDMEKSSRQLVCYGHSVPTTSSLGKRRLSKSERTRKSREMFCRRGSRILPDFFPPDMSTTKAIYDENIPSAGSTIITKKYSWENEENGESEAQTIAKSWMMYFGLDACK